MSFKLDFCVQVSARFGYCKTCNLAKIRYLKVKVEPWVRIFESRHAVGEKFCYPLHFHAPNLDVAYF